MSYAKQHLDEAARVIAALDTAAIEKMASLLADLRARDGRLFFLGVGGSAANCSHAVNDFRKIAGIEAYTPVDNVSELTARTNDEGWEHVFAAWLKGSHLQPKDMLFVLSVGGGSLERNISPNLALALEYARQVGSQIVGVVGRDGGYTAKVADACVIVPTVNPETVTPHAEAFQAIVWHLLVSHPRLKATLTKWEAIDGRRAVFLDRDGVINRPVVRDGKPHPPARAEDLEILPGVQEAVARLHEAGFRLVVVTNQADLARGTQRREVVDAMHARLASALPIDEFRVCDHDDGDDCACRKPKAGMLEAAAREGGLSLPASFMVGDRWRDVEAGRRAGFVNLDDVRQIVRSLPEATDWILSRLESERS